MQTFRKIKRVQPILKMKQMRVDEETAVLEAIRREKVGVVSAMKESQRRYMDGVDTLNNVRTSAGRANLETFESGLDHVKQQWWKLYRSVQDLERKEKVQIANVLTAERELKAVERLRDRYETEFRKELDKMDQRRLDEVALRRFSARES
jgi:flagellar export protein FliJ